MSHIDEEQQVEQLKEWWKENSKLVILTFVLVVGGVFGWKFWQNAQLQKKMQLSQEYAQVLSNVNGNTQEQQALVTKFVEQNSSSSYAIFALFKQANQALKANDFTNAVSYLEQAVNYSKDNYLKQVATLRLAEVLMDQQDYTRAEQQLMALTDKTFLAKKFLLLGHIAYIQGNNEQVKIHYNQAKQMNEGHLNPLELESLELRLLNLQ